MKTITVEFTTTAKVRVPDHATDDQISEWLNSKLLSESGELSNDNPCAECGIQELVTHTIEFEPEVSN